MIFAKQRYSKLTQIEVVRSAHVEIRTLSLQKKITVISYFLHISTNLAPVAQAYVTSTKPVRIVQKGKQEKQKKRGRIRETGEERRRTTEKKNLEE